MKPARTAVSPRRTPTQAKTHITGWSIVAWLKRIGVEPAKSFDYEEPDPGVQQALDKAATDGLKGMHAKVPTVARAIDALRLPPALLALLTVLTWTSASICASTQDFTESLDALLQQRHYVELEHALVISESELPPSSRAYFRGVLANRINHVQKSVRLLKPLIPTLLKNSPVRAELALCTLADDYARSFRYGNAARFYAQADRLAEQEEKNSECGAGREASRWGLLSNARAQTVTTAGVFTIRGKRDALGLFQVSITSGNYTGSWIVDSGANISVIGRSVANKLGVEMSTGRGTAEGIAGLSVPIRAGVIPEIRLGPALLRNVAVLVVKDSDLSFPKFDYRIEGSLGLPVLAALGRVTFHHDGRINFSPVERSPDKGTGSHNFFLEKFTPLISADFGHGTQLFTLDTGTMGTVLSAEFYEENTGIANVNELDSLELSGAGGTLALPAYQVPSLVAKFGGSCARVKDLAILTEATGLPNEFYGTIGESALSSFSSFTLDFHAMHFSVNGGNPGDCSDSVALASSERRGKSAR
jgi:Aspartyl protease